MISIIYGVPGSGKSYFSVWWIKKRVLEEGDVFFRVRLDRLLITNLKLRLDSEEGYIYVEDPHELAKYMDVDFWRANLQRVQGKKVVFVLDEAQRFFYFYGSDAKVLYFLQYHRHLGMDVLLITQTPRSIPQKVFELCEYVIESVPRSVNPFGFRAFRYRVLHPLDRSEVLRRFHLPYDPTVFYLYQDMIYSPEEAEERPSNAYVRYYAMLGGLVVVLVGLIYLFFSNFFSPVSAKSQTADASQTAVSSSTVPTKPITYEDLIVEVPEEKSEEKLKELDYSPKPLDVQQEKHNLDLPKDVSTRYGYIVVEASRSSLSFGSGLDVELSSGVKVVELP